MPLSHMRRVQWQYAAQAYGRFCSTLAIATKSVPKPITSMPTPGGALPLIGHLRLIIKNRAHLPLMAHNLFDELGPIFQLKLPAGYCTHLANTINKDNDSNSTALLSCVVEKYE